MTGGEAHELLRLWGCRARLSQEAHYLVATSYSFRQEMLTLTIVVVTAFTGSALFTSLNSGDYRFKIALGALSVFSAALAGFDRSKRYLENAEKHRQAGAAWTDVVHQTEILAEQLPAHPPSDIETRVQAIGSKIDDVTARSPQIPQRRFRKLGIDKTYLFACPPKPWWRRWLFGG